MFPRGHAIVKRGSRVLMVALAAALCWTAVAAEPAFALHNPARPYSIAGNGPDFALPNDTPNSFTCRWIHEENGQLVHDYRCGKKNFSHMLAGPGGSGDLLRPDGNPLPGTEVINPSRFKCELRRDFTGGVKLPSDYICKAPSGKRFRLNDVAFVVDETDPLNPLQFALPCARKCPPAPVESLP